MAITAARMIAVSTASNGSLTLKKRKKGLKTTIEAPETRTKEANTSYREWDTVPTEYTTSGSEI